MNPWRFLSAASYALALALVVACGNDTPTTPAPPQNPPAPPPRVISNSPPVVSDVRPGVAQIEAGDQMPVAATVADGDTPLDQLKYDWSSSKGGTFSGAGPTVSWRAPGSTKTPDTVTFTVTVNEAYKSGGEIQTNSASRTSTATVHFNDSPQEITQLATQFLTDFGTFSIAPEQVVKDFWPGNSCDRADELSDVKNNRKNFQIQSSTFTANALGISPNRQEGEVSGPCTFVNKTGSNSREQVSGTCHMTAIYNSFRWWLCESDFSNGKTTKLSRSTGMVPGRIVE